MPGEKHPERDWNMLRIMIADDEAVVTTHLMEHLTSRGYDVVGCSCTGEEAVAMARQLGPDIVLMDIVMPGKLDGIDAARIIRREIDIPIIFITAYTEKEIVERARSIEPHGYIAKPLNTRALEVAVDIALQKKEIEGLLRDAEERYRSLTDDVLDSSAVGIFILDADFRIIWINQAIERYFGLKRKSVLGRDKRRLIRDRIKNIFEDSEGFAKRVLATYDHNTHIESFECHVLPDSNREERWLEHWSQPIASGMYAGGRIEHYYDITGRKQAERLLQIQRDLSVALCSTSNMKRALDLLLEAACQIDGIDCGNVYLENRETGEVEQVSHRGLSPQFVESASSFPLDSPQVRLVESGKPVYGTYSELAPFADEVRKQEGIRAMALVPVHCEGKIISLMNLGSHTVVDFPEITRNAIETIGYGIGEVITRIRLEDELLQMLIGRLTSKELRFLKLLSRGFGRKDVSRMMYITESTYDSYFRNIRKKLNLKERNEVIKFTFDFKTRLK
jgi:PAS domain S-box-containing protein